MNSICPIAMKKFCAVVAALLMCQLASAQTDDLRLPMQLDADFTDYDGKNSMVTFRGLRLSQGSLSIEADEGRATKLDFQDSVWHLSGNVVINVDGSQIESDSAEMTFSEYKLSTAIIVGSPAVFRLKRPDNDVDIYAEAGRLQYDFSAGVIEFSEEATITQGGNQFSSNYLVYNIREQRIQASSGGEGNSKVRITYTPDDPGDEQPAEEEDNSAPGTESSQGGRASDE